MNRVCFMAFPPGRVRQTAPLLLQPSRRLAALLQRGQPRLLPERLGEVGPRNPPPLPPDPHPPGGHAVRPAAGRQGADRAGAAAGEARAGGGRQGAVGKSGRGDVHGVLGADAEEPEGGVRRRHRRGAEAL